MKIIGITGSSGSGKSSVCQIIEKNVKSKIINADKIAKELQDNRTEYYYKIIETFGKDILDEDNCINRKRLAEIVFKDKSQKQKLDKLTFKYVVDEIKRQIEIYQKENFEYIVVDAPTLIEANMNNMFNYIIAVIATKENKVARICKRDSISIEFAETRLAAQNEDSFYKKYADFIISNDDNTLDKKVREILQKMEGENFN